MRVWVETPFDNLPAEGFRRQRYWMMASAFVAAGHEVVYFTSDFNHGTKRRRRTDAAAASSDGIEVVFVRTPSYRRNVSLARVLSHWTYARRLARIVARRSDSPALVIAAAPTLCAATVMLREARRRQAPFALDVQDAWPETFVRLLPHALARLGDMLFWRLRRRARRLYAEADFVSGVCARYRELTGREDYYAAYLGISRSGASLPPRTVRMTPCRLVYAGNLGVGYDLETVIRAVAADGTLSLDIAGEGPRRQALEALAARSKACERVRFHGYLSAEALRNLLRDCDVGVIPMGSDSWVGLPNKLADYLDAGLRVLSSLGGECAALLARHGVGETYEVGSAVSLRHALERLGALPTAVAFPPELDAANIYPDYVRKVGRNCLKRVRAETAFELRYPKK